jgi:YD repeat-containing protein
VEAKSYFSDGSLAERYEYRYDSKGNKVEEKKYIASYDSQGKIFYITDIHRYDSQGNKVEGYFSDGSLEFRYEYRYDSQGKQVEVKSYDHGNLRYEYRYDSQGNKVEETEYKRNGSYRWMKYDDNGKVVDSKIIGANGKEKMFWF